MLFLGGFRHEPNRVALDWFVERVLPLVLAAGRKPGWWWPDPIPRRPTLTPITRRLSKCWDTWRMCASRWRATLYSSAPS